MLKTEYLDWYHALIASPEVAPAVAEAHRRAAQERFEDSLPFLESLPLGEVERVLDVGLGYGLHCRWFAERGKRVRGVSLDLPEGVREHAEHHGYEVEEADMHCTGLPDGAFDLVWSHHCLEHSFSPFAALLEWRRLLRPGGYLAVTVPPHKTEIVSGHFIVGWTTGQLLYVLGCTGYAVGQGRFVQQGYNIRALVRKEQQFNPEGKSYLCELKSLLPSSLARNLKDLPRSLGRYSFEGKLLEVTPRRVVCPPEKKEPSQREASPSLVSRLAARVRRFLGRHR